MAHSPHHRATDEEIQKWVARQHGFITEPSREASGFIYVLEGRLQVDAGGIEEILETGDCAFIESEMPLALSAAGNHRCRALTVLPAARNAEPKTHLLEPRV